jgi:uncharacterized membrane protein YjdF
MTPTLKALHAPALILLAATGTAFLLKMCYMPYWRVSLLGAAWLAAAYFYVRLFHGIVMPSALLVLVFGAVQVDALGNLFRMYGRSFGPVMYDEFAHMAVQALAAPLCVWLLGAALARLGYRPPLGILIFFSVTTLFSLTAFYEVVELWDERYFGGQRIWSTHDAPNDLQWNFLGILAGAGAAYLILRRVPGMRLQERSA